MAVTGQPLSVTPDQLPSVRQHQGPMSPHLLPPAEPTAPAAIAGLPRGWLACCMRCICHCHRCWMGCLRFSAHASLLARGGGVQARSGMRLTP